MRMCLVAEGEHHASVAPGAKGDWDLAAADLIVHEAGGVVSNIHGQKLVYNNELLGQAGMVSANPVLHEDICERLKSYKIK